ncbi:MAG TPA: FAD-dependent oxidoreductase, partial [Candidatus Obscuribacterales bacterium]
MSQVIIVGAGPAGVATAFLLAQRGIQVKLFEQEPTFDRVFRGEGLMPSGVAALTQMGLEDCLAAIPTRALTAWD